MALLPVDEALKRLLRDVTPTGSETLPLKDAGGRVLAEPMTAAFLQSPFDASAMDGYAIRANLDGTYPSIFKLIGESAAGKRFQGRIGPGETVRIFTGAPVPDNADTVIIQENTRRLSDGRIEMTEPVQPGRHIRRAGLDFKLGETLLPVGRVLDPAALALAAASGNANLKVFRQPRIAILATGDELVAPGQIPGPDQIVSSNSSGIAELVRINGGIAVDLGIVHDDSAQIIAAIQNALDKGIDCLVTLGGASVGDHDLVHKALIACGMELNFWKIAMRPGKPLMSGTLVAQDKRIIHVLGLPGNPVSCLVCGHIFLKPLVCALVGRSDKLHSRKAILTTSMRENDHRRDYVRADYQINDDGDLSVTPLPVQDSSMLSIMARANALIVREANAPAVPAGTPCSIIVLRQQ